MSLSGDSQADVIDDFNSRSRYLEDLANIDNPYFEGMVSQIYPAELQLIKLTLLIHVPRPRFLDLHLLILDGFLSSKIHDKRYDFDFDSLIFHFLIR